MGVKSDKCSHMILDIYLGLEKATGFLCVFSPMRGLFPTAALSTETPTRRLSAR